MVPTRTPLTRNQIRAFWAAWAGWALDGMDSFIFALVLVPSLRELLPRSGIPATTANIGYYGGLLFALFLVGWGLALLWGPVADRYGRVRTLMFTIICFSLFTLLSAFSSNIWMLAVFRILAGIGIGGEWAIGATLISEEWPEDRRTMGAGMMHTGYYFGFFLAALANYFIGSEFGWRWMFIIGGTPALVVGLIRMGMREPERWQARRNLLDASLKWTLKSPFTEIFSRRYRTRTMLNFMYQLVSTVGLWAGAVYVPAAVTLLAAATGRTALQAARMASYGTAILSIGTILGALSVPIIADRFGRRLNQSIFYGLMLMIIPLTFGYVFYLPGDALKWFLVCLFFLGVGGANFTVYSFWMPEQYGTECRASAMAFAQNGGRFVGAGATFLVGAGISHFETLGYPVALTALVFLLGLALLPFGVETKGKSLPA